MRRQILWNVTRSCNFRCHYCYFPHKAEPVVPAFDPGRLADMLDAAGGEWLVGMTGGEPLLYPDFAGLCSLLARRHRVAFDTNLSLSKVVAELADTVDPARVEDIYAAVHIEERERRGGVDVFIDNVLLLREKGFPVTVNYVLHPTLAERFPADRDFFAARGVRLSPRPFKGVFGGKTYPAAYGAEAKKLLGEKASRKMVYNFRGLPCHAGSRLLRLEPDGEVLRCPGDKTSLGNVAGGVTLLGDAAPCDKGRCPCQGLDYVGLSHAEARFVEGLQAQARGEAGRAMEAFAFVLALEPGHAGAANNLGVLAFQQGNLDMARTYFEKAARLNPAGRTAVKNLNSLRDPAAPRPPDRVSVDVCAAVQTMGDAPVFDED